MGCLWIHINSEPLGHLCPGNPPDPHDTTAVWSWNFKPTIPLPSHLFLSLLSVFYFLPSVHHTAAGLSSCVPVGKVWTIPHKEPRGRETRDQLVVSIAMRGDTKAWEDKYATTTERAECLCRNLSRSLLQKKERKKGNNKQSRRKWVNFNSDSKSSVRTHGGLLHGLWRLQSVCAGEILVMFF